MPSAATVSGRKRRWHSAPVWVCACGISARTLTIPESAWRLVFEPSIWAIVLNGLTAAVVFALALQKSGATAVTAIMLTTNTAVASVVGLAYLDDRVRDGFVAAAATEFVLAIAGAIGVAHHASTARHKSSAPIPVFDNAAT